MGSGSNGVRYFGIGGDGEGAERAAVVAALQRDRLGLARRQPGHLQGRLDCLRTGVREECPGDAGRRDPPDRLQRLGPDIAVEALVAGRQGAKLVAEGVGELRVGVAEDGDAVVAHRVEVAAAVGVEEVGAFAADERDLALAVERNLPLLLDLLDGREVDLGGCHREAPFIAWRGPASGPMRFQ